MSPRSPRLLSRGSDAMPTDVPHLLAAGRLEAVPPDLTSARARLARAARHLETSAKLRGQDNDMAYAALYDAARKAVTAHMLANGLRVPARVGAHEAIGVYAADSISDDTGAVREFQRMRRRRNKSEYEDILVGDQDIDTDLVHAGHIVAAVEAAPHSDDNSG